VSYIGGHHVGRRVKPLLSFSPRVRREKQPYDLGEFPGPVQRSRVHVCINFSRPKRIFTDLEEALCLCVLTWDSGVSAWIGSTPPMGSGSVPKSYGERPPKRPKPHLHSTDGPKQTNCKLYHFDKDHSIHSLYTPIIHKDGVTKSRERNSRRQTSITVTRHGRKSLRPCLVPWQKKNSLHCSTFVCLC
jgi:hypothetical protein